MHDDSETSFDVVLIAIFYLLVGAGNIFVLITTERYEHPATEKSLRIVTKLDLLIKRSRKLPPLSLIWFNSVRTKRKRCLFLSFLWHQGYMAIIMLVRFFIVIKNGLRILKRFYLVFVNVALDSDYHVFERKSVHGGLVTPCFNVLRMIATFFKTLIHFQTFFSWLQPRVLSGLHPSVEKHISHSKQGCQVMLEFINVRNIVTFFSGVWVFIFIIDISILLKNILVVNFNNTRDSSCVFFRIITSEDTSMMSFSSFS